MAVCQGWGWSCAGQRLWTQQGCPHNTAHLVSGVKCSWRGMLGVREPQLLSQAHSEICSTLMTLTLMLSPGQASWSDLGGRYGSELQKSDFHCWTDPKTLLMPE